MVRKPVRLIRGSEVWEIHHEGLIVRDGATSRRFQTAEQARTAYAKAVGDRQGLGWIEMPDVHTDLEARLVMADDLQQRGDPLGELIAIQHAMTTAPTPKLRAQLDRRMTGILEAHLPR